MGVGGGTMADRKERVRVRPWRNQQSSYSRCSTATTMCYDWPEFSSAEAEVNGRRAI